jgi:hypothetical protein
VLPLLNISFIWSTRVCTCMHTPAPVRRAHHLLHGLTSTHILTLAALSHTHVPTPAIQQDLVCVEQAAMAPRKSLECTRSGSVKFMMVLILCGSPAVSVSGQHLDIARRQTSSTINVIVNAVSTYSYN